MGVLTTFEVRFAKRDLMTPTFTEKKLMNRAVAWSLNSQDPSTKVGAVIASPRGRVLSADFNHFPPGLDDSRPERWERPAKYHWIGHAETNAIYQAAQKGIALAGSKIAVNWFPCVSCAKAIIAVGIRELIGFAPDYTDPRWGEEFKLVKQMLDEARIKLRLFNKEAFDPKTST